MSNFTIFADVTCDLTKNIRLEYNIEYFKGHMTLPNGNEVETELEWNDFTKDAFYADLKKNPNGYSTSPASPEEIKKAFRPFLEKGNDILSLSISTALSGTYNFTLQAKKELEEEFPGRKIYCIDSLRYSTGFGLLAVKASMLRSEGKSIDEIRDFIEENKFCVHQMGFLDDLSFVAAKGRLTKSKAFMGKLIGIKPMGEFDYNGLTTVIGKAKGYNQSIDAGVKYIKKFIVNPEDQIIFIGVTDRMKQALEYKDRIEKEIKPKEVVIMDVFPADGINIGPGLMSAFFFGTKITTGLEAEKKILTDILNTK